MIRKTKLKDLSEISVLYEKEMSKQFELIGEKPISSKEYEIILRKDFKKSEMYVLDENGIKVFLWFFYEDDEINLEEIFVSEKGKGYGKLLINFLLGEAKKNKIKRINCDIHIHNKDAINFFKHLGFTERTIEMGLDL